MSSPTTEQEVTDALAGLAIDDKDDFDKVDFVSELKASGFRIFEPISDHGFFTWKPYGKYQNLNDLSSIDDISKYIDLDGTPDRLVSPLSKLPLPLVLLSKNYEKTETKLYQNKFPFGQNEISHLLVAAKERGVNLEDIDFCFGGSTLEMLARHGVSGASYMTTKVPRSTDNNDRPLIMIAKRKVYTQDLLDNGFQVERAVTGQELGGSNLSPASTEHMHVVQVGSYRVLFCAETDALDDRGRIVEVKSSKPSNWGTKVMFQMISSGSCFLCHGVVAKGKLTRVNLRSLSSVAKKALVARDIVELENNILQGLDALRRTLVDAKAGDMFKVVFEKSVLKLLPARINRQNAMIPPNGVVQKLLSLKKT